MNWEKYSLRIIWITVFKGVRYIVWIKRFKGVGLNELGDLKVLDYELGEL